MAIDRQSSGAGGFTPLAAGTVVDRYRIESLIASGGFGITYFGRHTALGSPLAIKEHFPRQLAYREQTSSEIRPTDPHTYAWALDRFLQEGRTLARCRHPGVVSVADVFGANGTAYMVLGYEQGRSFKSWLDALDRGPTQAELDSILTLLLDALAYVHSQGLLHRDIAPDNIIIRDDGSPCLIDFGAARQAVAEQSELMSAIVKTGFSPPEQYGQSGRTQGPWSDIYALGATLYFAVSGTKPSDAPNRQLHDELQPLAELVGPGLFRPRFLEAIDHALRIQPPERPRSVEKWREALLAGAASATVSAGASRSEPPGVPPRDAPFEVSALAPAARPPPLGDRPAGPDATSGQPPRRPAKSLMKWAVPALAVAGIAAFFLHGELTSATSNWRGQTPATGTAPPKIVAPVTVAPKAAPQKSTSNFSDDPVLVDQSFQRTELWQLLKKEFPDWYQERVRDTAKLKADGKADEEIAQQLAEQLVALRRKHVTDALAASAQQLKSVASSFLANLESLSKHSVDACYGFISQGETSPLIVKLTRASEHTPALQQHSAAIFTAIAEGRRTPAKHSPPTRDDYDKLAVQLGKRGWSPVDLQLFADSRSLAKATPERVCKMVKDWFAAQLAVVDKEVQVRLLVEALKPVVAG